ncbi:hypothetical protein SDC9_184487 [bioreactor metagenome]|uniref:Uncharacterized protein n=1 Tax=bioreactor metagenome TaxID=1076179 RepID=A0A645HD64_9ZZZZ
MGMVAPLAVLHAKDQALIDQPISNSVVNRVTTLFINILSWSCIGIGHVNHRLDRSLGCAAVDRQRPDLQRKTGGLRGVIHHH